MAIRSPLGSTSGSTRFDVVVVGAGIAGANVASQLAERGLSVAVVDRRRFDSAGAHWHNGVLDRHFVRAGVSPPVAPERSPAVARFHMFAADGTPGARIGHPPTVTANMAMLGERLRHAAAEAGAKVFDESTVAGVDLVADRISSIRIESRTGTSTSLTAALFVDASGLTGTLRRHSPLLDRWCPPVRGDEICSASDFHFTVSDPYAASAFLERHGARPGEAISTVGLSGGFSTRGITISADLGSVAVLVGCLANGRYGTGPRMLSELRSTETWIGEPIHGGSGVIPLRRPYPRFTAPGLALVGDSSCHVYPAHGSGIGLGLIAGRILADTITLPVGSEEDVSSHSSTLPRDIGDEALLWRYQSSFMREFGPTLVASEGVRRMSTALRTDGVTALIRTGVMSASMVRAGLNQELVTPAPAELSKMASKLVREPLLAARLLPMLGHGRIASTLARNYPRELDLNALERWDRAVRGALGPLPR
ncbi:MAG: NAD(P)/FAD-dependent oxidoreductase [Microthrixaceae bacterium]